MAAKGEAGGASQTDVWWAEDGWDPGREVGEGCTGMCAGIENFEKIDLIGEGTYGTVYKVRDKRDGSLAALKKIKIDKSYEREGMPLTAFREIQVLKKLKHPNVVELKEVIVGGTYNAIFLLFEYCEHDLGKLVDHMKQRGKSFSGSVLKGMLHQVLSGLSYLHENFIFHRDLKMSNLLYTSRGEVKICDFGLARPFSDPPSPGYTPEVLTLWYRPPELLLGTTTYGAEVDMWSLGCIFGELVRMSVLLPGKTDMQQLSMITALLGPPTLAEWPDMDLLPLSKAFWKQEGEEGQGRVGSGGLQRLFERLEVSRSGISFLEGLLAWNPAERMGAAEALAHPYFKEVPQPAKASCMPIFQSLHKSDQKEEPPPLPFPPPTRERRGGGNQGDGDAPQLLVEPPNKKRRTRAALL